MIGSPGQEKSSLFDTIMNGVECSLGQVDESWDTDRVGVWDEIGGYDLEEIGRTSFCDGRNIWAEETAFYPLNTLDRGPLAEVELEEGPSSSGILGASGGSLRLMQKEIRYQEDELPSLRREAGLSANLIRDSKMLGPGPGEEGQGELPLCRKRKAVWDKGRCKGTRERGWFPWDRRWKWLLHPCKKHMVIVLGSLCLL